MILVFSVSNDGLVLVAKEFISLDLVSVGCDTLDSLDNLDSLELDFSLLSITEFVRILPWIFLM